MVARARAFEPYHAKTIFIKATCYHYISSSPNPYIIINVFQRQSQRSALFSGCQSFCCKLEGCECCLLVQETGQPTALECPERDGAHHSSTRHQADTEEGPGGGERKAGGKR